jgi:hypothetical protein
MSYYLESVRPDFPRRCRFSGEALTSHLKHFPFDLSAFLHQFEPFTAIVSGNAPQSRMSRLNGAAELGDLAELHFQDVDRFYRFIFIRFNSFPPHVSAAAFVFLTRRSKPILRF